MNTSQIYILIGLIVLTAIMVILILTRKKIGKPLSRLAAFSFAFIIAGLIFGESRLIGYSLMGIGVVFAIIDIIKKLLKNPGASNNMQ